VEGCVRVYVCVCVCLCVRGGVGSLFSLFNTSRAHSPSGRSFPSTAFIKKRQKIEA
jgi:hypothetical protein